MVRGKVMVNKVALTGKMEKDPDIRYTPNGTPVITFRIATTAQWKNKKRRKSTKKRRISDCYIQKTSRNMR